ncbi:hypothetical protein OIU77_015530 [Salix suchowensis]|uniref:Uncharacterized protein n=1 Tax=Salix suchowensis TaxID=1278906 RepID=A0ABQ8ZHQ1_9ROSI|nr:hypothetical protein OIU77_015530 [Salix suchowensis]
MNPLLLSCSSPCFPVGSVTLFRCLRRREGHYCDLNPREGCDRGCQNAFLTWN